MPVSVAESEENSVVASVRVKRAGASTQPCLMPLDTGKGSDTNLFFHYASHHSNKERLMMLTNLGGQSSLRSMANRPSRLTVSKALVVSTKRMYRF